MNNKRDPLHISALRWAGSALMLAGMVLLAISVSAPSAFLVLCSGALFWLAAGLFEGDWLIVAAMAIFAASSAFNAWRWFF